MKKDIIPTTGAKLTAWAETFKKNVAQNAAVLNLSPSEVGNIDQLCTEMIEQRKATQVARNLAKAEGKKEKALQQTNVGKLRKYISKIKASPGVASNTMVGLGVKRANQKPVEETYQPKISVAVEGELIRVKFKKYGVDRMEFWGSCNGAGFQRLESRSRSPFYFKPEPQSNHLPQRWHIKAIAIYKDKHFGKWSEILTVLYESGTVGL